MIKCSSFSILYCPNINVFINLRRGYNAHHCLITLIEKWKKSVENGGAFVTILTDLSKVFDCLPHELLIAKLYA